MRSRASSSRTISSTTPPRSRRSWRRTARRKSLPTSAKRCVRSPNGRVESLEAVLKVYCERTGKGFGKVAQPLRVAVTGTSVSPPMFETLVLLGREKTLSRVDETLRRMAELIAQSA